MVIEKGKVSAADVIEVAERCRNWERWGSRDELGTVNFIDTACVLRAAALVKKGTIISCALPYDADGPQNGGFGRVNPIHVMLQDGGDAAIGAQNHLAGLRYADDAVYMPLQCGTQWDALSHVFYDGVMYNGYSQGLVSSSGTSISGIEKMADKIVTRGVLLDIPRHKGVEWLEPGVGVSANELSDCADAAGVTIDAVTSSSFGRELSRWRGRLGRGVRTAAAMPRVCPFPQRSGFARMKSLGWRLTLGGWKCVPMRLTTSFSHCMLILIVNAGMLVGEIFDLDELGVDCASDGRYEFMFVAPPLPFTGAVGSPLNPIAIK